MRHLWLGPSGRMEPSGSEPAFNGGPFPNRHRETHSLDTYSVIDDLATSFGGQFW